MTDVLQQGGPEFRESEAFRVWLESKPREWAVALAARAALRVAPLGGRELYAPERENKTRELFLRLTTTVLRATTIARVAGAYPTRPIAAAARSAALSYSDAEIVAATASGTVVATAAATATTAATAAVFAAATVPNTAIDIDAGAAVTRAAFAVGDAGEFWRAVSRDAQNLATGGGVAALASEPLWPFGAPDWAYEAWSEWRGALPKGEHWEVWIDWYEARLNGRRWSDEKEWIYADVPDYVWDDGHVAANSWIYDALQKLEELEPRERLPLESAIPEAAPAGAGFTGGGREPIDLVADPPAHDPLSDPEQCELYGELRALAAALAATAPNLLAEFHPVAEGLVAALPQDMARASVRILWSRGNAARKFVDAHKEAMKRRDGVKFPEPDAAEMQLVVAARFSAFVDTFNIFVLGDEKMLALDAQSLSPDERTRTQEALRAITPLLDDLSSVPDVATAPARETVQELAHAGANAPEGASGDKDRALAKDTSANFVLRLVRGAWAFLKEQPGAMRKGVSEGVYRDIGRRALEYSVENWPLFIVFIHPYVDDLIAFSHNVWNSPGVVQIIEAVRALF